MVAEGKTVEETVAIAEDLARILLELDRHSERVETLFAMPNQLEYPLLKHSN